MKTAACLVVLVGCGSSAAPGAGDGGGRDDSRTGSGGMGSGGRADASGGSNGTGGTTTSGGTTGAGGANATGGVSGSGGTNGSGGRAGTGGTSGSGGRAGTGGSAGGGGSASGGSSGTGEFGFTYRKPGPTDVDWLCTLRQGDVSGHVYAQFNQTGTMMAGIATIPVYAPAVAQISVGGTPSNLANVQYDYGGGHHNDALRFEYQGASYQYYHSSFGFGFRKCQPMDCLNVSAAGTTTPAIEGCTAARAHPEVCVPIKADGTHDPLVDTFMKCAGDTARLGATDL